MLAQFSIIAEDGRTLESLRSAMLNDHETANSVATLRELKYRIESDNNNYRYVITFLENFVA
jgi:hypothetical protein